MMKSKVRQTDRRKEGRNDQASEALYYCFFSSSSPFAHLEQFDGAVGLAFLDTARKVPLKGFGAPGTY